MKTTEENNWSVRQGTLNSTPIFISFLKGINSADNRRRYPYQIGVAVPLLRPTIDGLPTDTEAQLLWKIEDELQSKLGTEHEALYVMSVTTKGMREFVFYTHTWKPKLIEQTVKEIERKIGDGHELQFLLQRDEDWKTYQEFVPLDSIPNG